MNIGLYIDMPDMGLRRVERDGKTLRNEVDRAPANEQIEHIPLARRQAAALGHGQATCPIATRAMRLFIVGIPLSAWQDRLGIGRTAWVIGGAVASSGPYSRLLRHASQRLADKTIVQHEIDTTSSANTMATEITSRDSVRSPWAPTSIRPAIHPAVVPRAEAPRPKPNTRIDGRDDE